MARLPRALWGDCLGTTRSGAGFRRARGTLPLPPNPSADGVAARSPSRSLDPGQHSPGGPSSYLAHAALEGRRILPSVAARGARSRSGCAFGSSTARLATALDLCFRSLRNLVVGRQHSLALGRMSLVGGGRKADFHFRGLRSYPSRPSRLPGNLRQVRFQLHSPVATLLAAGALALPPSSTCTDSRRDFHTGAGHDGSAREDSDLECL